MVFALALFCSIGDRRPLVWRSTVDGGYSTGVVEFDRRRRRCGGLVGFVAASDLKVPDLVPHAAVVGGYGAVAWNLETVELLDVAMSKRVICNVYRINRKEIFASLRCASDFLPNQTQYRYLDRIFEIFKYWIWVSVL